MIFDASDAAHLLASFAMVFILNLLITVLGTWWMAVDLN
jgi:hypothetical protein